MPRIEIIYDNTSVREGMKPDWGFAALIKAHGKTILFDTGGNGRILLDNMQILGIDPRSISDVFISHAHFDHIGGLAHFLEENNAVTLHAPVSFRGVKSVKAVKYYDHPQPIHEGIYTTGELENIEQAMAVETGKGLVLINGCSHPAMKKIISAAESFGTVYGIIGGLHGFDQFSLFHDFGLICPTHCTEHITEIKELYPKAYIAGGAGTVIEI
jgi:7,8-dihydropterin-6-yl-methyl-4-(beta-D-ribofuranosyl)aminobenzene 5'-phosphate synthase